MKTKSVKIAFLGAGSFVFGPSMIRQTILEHRLDDGELALMDVDAEMVQLTAAAARRIAQATGVATAITEHTTRDTALPGADFVIYSVAPQLRKRHAMDCEIVEKFAPSNPITEFGGVAGISYSLRQIALIEQVAADIRRLCPSAWLLDSANPLPRVCQAAQASGVKTVGFCSASQSVHAYAWKLLRDELIDYPWTAARDRWEMTAAGLNHFNWLLQLRDRATGQDLLPALQAAIRSGKTAGQPRCERFCLETGFMLLPDDRHTTDFIVPDEFTPPRRQPYHGLGKEREDRLASLRAIAAGQTGWEPLAQVQAWERPLDLIAALRFGKPLRMESLNLLNEGQVPNLSRSVFVETPCQVGPAGLQPETHALPEVALPLARNAARVTDTIVRAALQRSRPLLREAVDADPTITEKTAGWKAIEECLKTHADLLGNW